MVTRTMQGKVCLVTGSSSGIGKVTPSSALSYNVAIRHRLWDVTEEMIRQNELSHVILEK